MLVEGDGSTASTSSTRPARCCRPTCVARVLALREALPTIDVGFHGHNNLALAIGNTLAAIEAGATRVDGWLAGLGAGAGNADRGAGRGPRARRDRRPASTSRALDAAEYVVRGMMPFQPIGSTARR